MSQKEGIYEQIKNKSFTFSGELTKEDIENFIENWNKVDHNKEYREVQTILKVEENETTT